MKTFLAWLVIWFFGTSVVAVALPGRNNFCYAESFLMWAFVEVLVAIGVGSIWLLSWAAGVVG